MASEELRRIAQNCARIARRASSSNESIWPRIASSSNLDTVVPSLRFISAIICRLFSRSWTSASRCRRNSTSSVSADT